MVATNDHSRKIFDRMGMEVMSEMDWADIQIQGQRPFTGTASKAVSSHYGKLDHII